MQGVIARIVSCHDPADDFATGEGEEQCGIAMLIKWVFRAIEELLSLDQQRRHPGRIVHVNAPGKFDESVQIPARADWFDLDLSHGCVQSCLERAHAASTKERGFKTADLVNGGYKPPLLDLQPP